MSWSVVPACALGCAASATDPGSADQAASGQSALEQAPADPVDVTLLEMVNAGLVPTIVVDSHKAHLWAEVSDAIRVHEDLAVRAGGQIAWAFRKDSPQLADVVNEFVATHRTRSTTSLTGWWSTRCAGRESI